eukprot:6057449-Amphidinium_carterae.1
MAHWLPIALGCVYLHRAPLKSRSLASTKSACHQPMTDHTTPTTTKFPKIVERNPNVPEIRTYFSLFQTSDRHSSVDVGSWFCLCVCKVTGRSPKEEAKNRKDSDQCLKH